MRIIILSIALLFCAFTAQSQVFKSAGVWYFLDVDSMTARPAVLPNGTELAYVIGTRKIYNWNRITSTWEEYGGGSAFNRDSIYFDASIIGSGTVSDPWGVDSTLFATIAGVGDSIAAALGYVAANYFPLQGGTLTGTGGSGFVGFPLQSSPPATPSTGFSLYAGSTGNNISWMQPDGFFRRLISPVTGTPRQYQFMARSYTLADSADVAALPTGTGTTNYYAKWSSTNALGIGNLFDNNTVVSILNNKPLSLGQWTTAGRPGSVDGYIGRNTTTGFDEGYFTSEWRNYVTSTGATSGQVSVFSSAGQVYGTSNFFWDNTNGGLQLISNATTAGRGLIVRQTNSGIQAAPIQFEKIRGSSAVQNGDLIGAFTLRGYSGTQYITDNTLFGGLVTGTVTSSSVPTSIFFNAGSTTSNYNTHLLVHSNGTVGVGEFGSIVSGASIVAPSNLLHVRKTVAGGYVTSQTENLSSTGYTSFLNTNNLGYTSRFIKWGSGAGSYKTITANSTAIYNSAEAGNITLLNDFSSGAIDFSTGGSSTAQMTLASTGRLGIGTTSPQRLFHVAGETRITDLTTDPPTQIVGADADGDLGAVGLGNLAISGGALTAQNIYNTNGALTGDRTVSGTSSPKLTFASSIREVEIAPSVKHGRSGFYSANVDTIGANYWGNSYYSETGFNGYRFRDSIPLTSEGNQYTMAGKYGTTFYSDNATAFGGNSSPYYQSSRITMQKKGNRNTYASQSQYSWTRTPTYYLSLANFSVGGKGYYGKGDTTFYAGVELDTRSDTTVAPVYDDYNRIYSSLIAASVDPSGSMSYKGGVAVGYAGYSDIPYPAGTDAHGVLIGKQVKPGGNRFNALFMPLALSKEDEYVRSNYVQLGENMKVWKDSIKTNTDLTVGDSLRVITLPDHTDPDSIATVKGGVIGKKKFLKSASNYFDGSTEGFYFDGSAGGLDVVNGSNYSGTVIQPNYYETTAYGSGGADYSSIYGSLNGLSSYVRLENDYGSVSNSLRVQLNEGLSFTHNSSFFFNVDTVGTMRVIQYGTGAKTTTALSKTFSTLAGFATDGTVLNVEQKRDTTIYINDTDYDWSVAITTAQIASRFNRVIFWMTTTGAAGSDSDLTLHTPDANLMQVEYLIHSVDEAGGFSNKIVFGTNNAVDSTNGLVTNYYPAAGDGIHIRAGLRSGVYKYRYSN